MIKEKGGVNAAVFIEFLKRLITGAARAIFLIVDRGPAHIAKKTKAFVGSLNGRLRLFYLPPYSPDRNPDELVWKHLKADTVGRSSVGENRTAASLIVLRRSRGLAVPCPRAGSAQSEFIAKALSLERPRRVAVGGRAWRSGRSGRPRH